MKHFVFSHCCAGENDCLYFGRKELNHHFFRKRFELRWKIIIDHGQTKNAFTVTVHITESDREGHITACHSHPTTLASKDRFIVVRVTRGQRQPGIHADMHFIIQQNPVNYCFY